MEMSEDEYIGYLNNIFDYKYPVITYYHPMQSLGLDYFEVIEDIMNQNV